MIRYTGWALLASQLLFVAIAANAYEIQTHGRIGEIAGAGAGAELSDELTHRFDRHRRVERPPFGDADESGDVGAQQYALAA